MFSTSRTVTSVIVSSILAYVFLFTEFFSEYSLLPHYTPKNHIFPVSANLTENKEAVLFLASLDHTTLPSNVSIAEVPKVELPVESTDLSKLCGETEWTEGLWLHCHSGCGVNGTSICGGLNNARNRVQTCIRLAIDAGAGVIIPSATTRNEEALVDTNAKTVCPSFFWDMKHLKSEVGKQCPQLKVRVCDDRSGISKIVTPPKRTYLEAPHSKDTFRGLVKNSFEKSNYTLSSVTASSPALIEFSDTYIGWDYKKSSELSTIRKSLFKALQFNKDLLHLSTEVLKSPQLNNGAFIGIHLRAENDWPAGFGTAEDQMRLYVAEIERIQTTVSYVVDTIYVSSGDIDGIQRFRDMLEPLGYIVHDKWTLLANEPETLAYLEALPFDQKGIVEYNVLVDARFWIGIITSSMSSLIAYARTVDEREDYFETSIFPDSSREGLNRGYTDNISIKGNQYTKLMVVNGVDIMDSFP
ncbi:uncharacterized protein BP5553_10150 [Venustampulla echinocandica]|uniref:Uncharacterized protein n=1 Tax=Venustampulla echinocandica TaxID=2656787 RepID=A0A370TAI3_9HELO|nr:uncharacterized protein BP5553_10150 [Venustampulla echinocandica]RDL30805.1 hypothetical protein BP5553_10150 [Venustampulla echinocandica]